MKLVAVTGATGFLGRHLLDALAARGVRIRILVRRDPSPALGVAAPGHPPHEIVRGSLEDLPALVRLVQGADVVVHAAGVIKARSRRDFMAVNRDGAARLAAAARQAAPGAHLIGVSSLAARAAHVSDYAASKRAGEAALAAGFSGRLSLVRPPIIYGPPDRETLRIFRAARLPVVPVPGPANARLAMIHVTDAAAAIAAVADWPDAPGGTTHALADPNPSGYAPREILRLAATLVGNDPVFLPLPAAIVRAVGGIGSLLATIRGRASVLDAGKAREMSHGQWAVSRSEQLPPSVFMPEIELRQGFAATIDWYRRAGWLAPRRGLP